jgi:ABC-2 type transport system permease protein
MGLLFLFLSVGLVARSLLDEKRRHVLDRMRVSPIRPSAILAGKCASTVVLGVLSLAVIWLVTALALGADWGDPVGVVLLIVTSALAVAGIAGVVAAVARTDQAAESFATMVAFVLALVGGNFIPLGDLPDALRRVSLLSPNGWALQGFAELSAGGGSAGDVVPHALVLLGFGVVTSAIAAVLLPRRLESAR